MNRTEYIFQSHQLSTSYDFWKKRNFDFSKILLRDLGTQNNHVHIMDSGQNYVYTTFPNFFSLISADSADLSKSQKNHIFEKKGDFFIENWL